MLKPRLHNPTVSVGVRTSDKYVSEQLFFKNCFIYIRIIFIVVKVHMFTFFNR